MKKSYLNLAEHLEESWPGESPLPTEEIAGAESWQEAEALLSGWARANAGELARRETAALTALENPWEAILRKANGDDLGWMER